MSKKHSPEKTLEWIELCSVTTPGHNPLLVAVAWKMSLSQSDPIFKTKVANTTRLVPASTRYGCALSKPLDEPCSYCALIKNEHYKGSWTHLGYQGGHCFWLSHLLCPYALKMEEHVISPTLSMSSEALFHCLNCFKKSEQFFSAQKTASQSCRAKSWGGKLPTWKLNSPFKERLSFKSKNKI